MPIYEYRCPKGHEVEVLHRMDDPPPTTCEVCGAGPLQRVFHPVPVFFKGSGFYSTDYGRRKRTSDTGGGGGGEGDGAKSTGDSAKPAEKPAEKSTKTAET